jgi:hypothetical protein
VSGIPYWPSRDPREENGGVNLYGFVGNKGIGRIDMLGTEEKALEPGDFAAMVEIIHSGAIEALKKSETDFLAKLNSDDPYVTPVDNGGKNGTKYIPLSPAEYGGRVCEKCFLGKDGKKLYSYYLKTTHGIMPVSSDAEVFVLATMPCDDGDKLVATWHTHPSVVSTETDRGSRPIGTKPKTKYYWGKGVELSDGDKNVATGTSLRTFVTRRDQVSSLRWRFETLYAMPVTRQVNNAKKSEFMNPTYLNIKEGVVK